MKSDKRWRSRKLTGDAILGARVREIRQTRNMTLEQVAGAAGLNTQNLSKLETGSVGYSPASIRRLAEALGVPVWHLFLDREMPPVYFVPWADDIHKQPLANSTGYSGREIAATVSDDALNESEPRFKRGDIVIIDPGIEPAPECAMAVRVDGKILIRRCRFVEPGSFVEVNLRDLDEPATNLDGTLAAKKFELLPDSRFYPTITIPSEYAQLLGRVVQRIVFVP